MTGDGLRSPIDERLITEISVVVPVLNRMLELGRPSYVDRLTQSGVGVGAFTLTGAQRGGFHFRL